MTDDQLIEHIARGLSDKDAPRARWAAEEEARKLRRAQAAEAARIWLAEEIAALQVFRATTDDDRQTYWANQPQLPRHILATELRA